MSFIDLTKPPEEVISLICSMGMDPQDLLEALNLEEGQHNDELKKALKVHLEGVEAERRERHLIYERDSAEQLEVELFLRTKEKAIREGWRRDRRQERIKAEEFQEIVDEFGQTVNLELSCGVSREVINDLKIQGVW